MNIKKKIIDKLEKLQIMLKTPGAFAARREGCYFELYRKIYRLYAMGFRPKTILDIGANRGMFTRCVHYVFPNAAIHAFEPLKDCYEDLCILKNKIYKLECYNIALADQNGESSILRSNYDYSSSLLEMDELHKQAFPYTDGGHLEKIKTRTLDNIFSVKRIQRPLLMKIDVQGYEKYVFAGAAETLKQTDYILCEMSFRHLYKGQAIFNEVYNQIINAGFRFLGHMDELLHPQTTEVLQIDGLFIRNR